MKQVSAGEAFDLTLLVFRTIFRLRQSLLRPPLSPLFVEGSFLSEAKVHAHRRSPED